MTEQSTRADDRYELLRQLGEGGVGKVYLALERETGERIALKKLTRMTPLSVLRFKREFRALADLRHPNLVKLYELEHADDGWFLTMELVEGVDLVRGLDDAWGAASANDNASDIEADRARIVQLADVFTQLAHAIHAIHQAGMLHRDLKPSNVLLTRDGRVVVLDFGLVRELGQPAQLVTLEGNVAGTPAYMPPEQARGDEELTAASDWYSFGVMFYQALSGGLPFDGRNSLELIMRKLGADAPPLPRSAGPQRLRQLCSSLLQRDAHKRPGAEEVLRVLSEHAEAKQRTIEPITNFTQYATLTPDTQTQHSTAELFGRDAERVRLEAALTRCIRERSTIAVHVRGPSGSGKSALVQSFLSDSVPLVADAAEPLVLRSRCYEREAMPFKSIDGIVDTLATYLMRLTDVQVAYVVPRDLVALTALFPVFERVPTVQQLLASEKGAARGDSLALRRRAEQGFRTLLSNVATTTPVVIWIDDLQWGDLDSTQVLHDWLKKPIEAHVLLVLSYRGDDLSTSPCLAELFSPEAKQDHVVQQLDLDLQPLGDADIQTLCRRRIGPATSSASAVAQIVRSSQGNPYLATQLTALARVKLARGETDFGSLSIEELVHHTSSMLSAPALQLLRVLSVAGRPLAPRIALATSEVLRNQRALIHELQTLRLVRTRYAAGAAMLEVYHDGVRRSVQASLTEADRKQIHAALLKVVLQEPSTDPAWLHELAVGAEQLGYARHYGTLAAEKATANLAFERAAELYERCVQLAATDAERAQLLKKLALARVRCRRGSQAADAYLQASELASEQERVELLKLAASHLLRSGRFDEGERLVQKVIKSLNLSVPESDAGLYAAIGWERSRIAVLERFIKPRADAVLPPDRMRVGMTYAMLALDTQCYTPLRATLFQMRATRICFQYGEQQTTARAYCMNAALATLSADDRAAKHVDEMLARAEALIDRKKHPAALLELYCSQSVCSMLLGRLADVLPPARAAEELRTSNAASSEHGDYFYVFVVRTARVSALQFLGRHREAAEVAKQLLEDAELTNNRCAALQATMARTNLEQVQTCCRDSRARLDAERAELPQAMVSVLHVLHVISVIRTACITGEYAWAFEVFAEFEPRFKKSPLQRSGFLVYLLRVSHARVLLNHHVVSKSQQDPESLIGSHLKWLAQKGPVPFRKLAPQRLLARIAVLRSDRARAAHLLEESRCAHVEAGAVDEAERDRYALGPLTGGEEGARLTAAASAALRSMGINEPEREIRGYYPELIRGA